MKSNKTPWGQGGRESSNSKATSKGISIYFSMSTGTERCSQPNVAAAPSAAAQPLPCHAQLCSAQGCAGKTGPTPSLSFSFCFDGKHFRCWMGSSVPWTLLTASSPSLQKRKTPNALWLKIAIPLLSLCSAGLSLGSQQCQVPCTCHSQLKEAVI